MHPTNFHWQGSPLSPCSQFLAATAMLPPPVTVDGSRRQVQSLCAKEKVENVDEH